MRARVCVSDHSLEARMRKYGPHTPLCRQFAELFVNTELRLSAQTWLSLLEVFFTSGKH